MITGIKDIDGIGASDEELLEAVGISCGKDLARSEPELLYAELLKANQMLQLTSDQPDLNQVRSWVAASRGEEYVPENYENGSNDEPTVSGDLLSHEETPVSHIVNFESDPKILEMLNAAPIAIPVANRVLAERGISPAEVEIAPLLNHAEGDIEVAISASQKTKPQNTSVQTKRTEREVGLVQTAATKVERVQIDSSRVRKLEDFQDPDDPKPTKRETVDRTEEVKLIRSARESTNKGKDPNSRRYIRGVLHNRPFTIWWACLVAILFLFMIPVGFASAILLMLGRDKPDTFYWVPHWLIALPIALLVLGLFYLIFSTRAKCRVCGQKLLVPRHCRKHVKAHHIPIIGYILPLALHALTYLWFRCTFCGTSLRIKE